MADRILSVTDQVAKDLWRHGSTRAVKLMKRYPDEPWRVGDTFIVKESFRVHMYGWTTQIDYRAGGSTPAIGVREDAATGYPAGDYDVQDAASAWIEKHGGFLDFEGARQDRHTARWWPANLMPRALSRFRVQVCSLGVEQVGNHRVWVAGLSTSGVETSP